jgi:SAM-dependent methyltransferase
MSQLTLSLDLGCGSTLKNPFNATKCIGIDVVNRGHADVIVTDLCISTIPLLTESVDFVTAYDFLEHIPRVIYNPTRRNCFVELMNEIYRVLKPGGLFFSFTPAYPNMAAFSDPTHVNIITDETFPTYFDTKKNLASVYGFKGGFEIVSQEWQHPHLKTLMRRP